MSFALVTDTSANLPTYWLRTGGVDVIPFAYSTADGQEHTCLDTAAFDSAAYYGRIRAGERITTSQINPFAYTEVFRPLLEQGRDVVFVGMSSGISGSFHMAEMAAESLREEFPDRQLYLVDTLGASLGEGLLVMQAAALRGEGKSARETFCELQALRHRMVQIFTVDDLMHLKRTGRLFGAAAVVGTMLQIKPLLTGDPEGRIVSVGRARGRAKAIATLGDMYDRLVVDAPGQTVGIAHADCADDAWQLADRLRRNHPPKQILTVDYEPVTGSHVGPGALALFFLGEDDARRRIKGSV